LDWSLSFYQVYGSLPDKGKRSWQRLWGQFLKTAFSQASKVIRAEVIKNKENFGENDFIFY
jgi:hypothetical protein